MKLILQATLAAAVVSLAFATPARAEANAPASEPTHTAQAEKRIECVHDKDAKAGSPRDDCVEAPPAREPQTHKMVRCNEEARTKQLHGDERRAFMSACLKG
jgi:psiF repeat-containing protein